MKLKKALSEFNIGLQTAIEFLRRKGWNDIDNEARPDTKISEEQYLALKNAYSTERYAIDKTNDSIFTYNSECNIDRPFSNNEKMNIKDKIQMGKTFNESVATWLQFRKTGRVKEARDYYRNHLFRQVIDHFIAKEYTGLELQTDVLISFLGYSPEPVILAEGLLAPKLHIILHDKNLRNNIDNATFLSDFPYGNRSTIEIPNETFGSIYETLKEQVAINQATSYTINITGGKKSMAASAGIFGRDFGCNIIYIDYEDNSYDPDIRVPLPGHERLNVVYSPLRDLPELFHLPQ